MSRPNHAITHQVQSSGTGPVPRNTKEWSTGLYAMCDDMKICLLVWLCGGFYMCYLSHKLGENICVPACVGVIPIRLKIRMLRGIEGTICDDCCMLYCCGPCAVCQMAREMKEAGYLGPIQRE